MSAEWAPDAGWARSFAKALKDRGVPVWFHEREAPPGKRFLEAMETALRDSDVIVALIDPKRTLSPALSFEIGAAIGMGKKVIPVVAREVDPSSLPAYFRLRRYLVRQSPEETAEELSNTIAAA